MTETFPHELLYTDQVPNRLYRAEDVRALDKTAIEVFGIPGLTLMERAGAAAFQLLREFWPNARNITVVCGAGNNGGDGFVVARLAKASGLEVTLILLTELDRLSSDALTVAKAYQNAGGQIGSYQGVLTKADLYVDGVLGTGLDRDVKAPWSTILEEMNQSPTPVFALDIPSGLHSDTGISMGVKLKAQATISFIGLKQGCFTGEAPELCGKIFFSDLDVPTDVYDRRSASATRLHWPKSSPILGRRNRISHKGDHGRALLIGGDTGMAGAIRLAGESTARTGAGLITIATRARHAISICAQRPELMCHGVEDPAQILPFLVSATVIAMGPGLGQSSWSRAIFSRVIERSVLSSTPIVLDADALNLLAQDPSHNEHWILTPHPGEAARLLGCSVAEIQVDRFDAIRRLQGQYGGVVVLKGAGTLVYAGEAHMPKICTDGNPGMAVGGMGDTLTGIIAGLLAQGMRLEEAASAGVAIHAASADLAAEKGERGMLATDLLGPLRSLINGLPSHP